jgi:hypothetical protein
MRTKIKAANQEVLENNSTNHLHIATRLKGTPHYHYLTNTYT